MLSRILLVEPLSALVRCSTHTPVGHTLYAHVAWANASEAREGRAGLAAGPPLPQDFCARALPRGSKLLLEIVKRFDPRIPPDIAQHLLDAQELVVLGHAIGARRGAALDLARVGGHGQVGEGGVFCLAGAV